MSSDRPGPEKPLQPLQPLQQGVGQDQGQAGSEDMELAVDAREDLALDDGDDDEPESARPVARPNLEPVGDDAHPPQNRRMPTQPSLVLDLRDDDRRALTPASASSSPASSSAKPPVLPAPPVLGPRHSPAPVRRGLFSGDQITNLLTGVVIGLVLMIYPAKKLARSYEIREVEPLLSELDGAIEHPLGVEAGVVEAPEKIAAKIHAGRDKVRNRYLAIWLLVGLPLGLGLGFVPRPGE